MLENEVLNNENYALFTAGKVAFSRHSKRLETA